MDEEAYNVEAVRDDRKLAFMPDGYHKIELRIKWEGYDEGQNTWEPLHVMWDDINATVRDYFARKEPGQRVIWHPTKKELCKLENLTPKEVKENLLSTE